MPDVLSWQRVILHVDMDAFFAAIEQMDHPELRGKPILIGHDGPRGVVATASYEARPFGCRSAMPMAQARQLCPHAIVVPVRGARYHEISQQVFEVFDEFSPTVEPLSVDEAFLDISNMGHLLGTPVEAAKAIKQRIRQKVGLTASVGVATCKYLAKLASDLKKPDGLMVIEAQHVDTVLPPLPVTRLWGVGKATAARMEARGIKTIGDVRRRGLECLTQMVGNDAGRLWDLAHGIDLREVVPDREAKSMGHEQTFEQDIADPDAVRDVLLQLTEQVGARLRRHGIKTRGITLKVRYGSFQTISRSMVLPEATAVTRELWIAARGMFDLWARQFRPVRLIGITAGRLEEGAGKQTAHSQLLLFEDATQTRQTRLDELTDRINQRFGAKGVRRGGS